MSVKAPVRVVAMRERRDGAIFTITELFEEDSST